MTTNLIPNETTKDGQRMVKEMLDQAFETGKWMVAAWYVKDGMLTLAGRSTFDFPNGDYQKAAALLNVSCEAEIASQIAPEPLPRGILPNLKDVSDSVVIPTVVESPAEDAVMPDVALEGVSESLIKFPPVKEYEAGLVTHERPTNDSDTLSEKGGQ